MAALLLTSALSIFQARPAHACSCEQTTAATLDRVDGAVIGIVTAVDDIDDRWPGQDSYAVTVAVEIDVKNNLDDSVVIDAIAADGGNCGDTWRVGDEIAAIVGRQDDGSLAGGGCGGLPRSLAESYAPPAADGGLAEVIVFGDNGSYRSVAYDATGEPVAYGFDAGYVRVATACDDGDAFIELVEDRGPADAPAKLAIRSLATFDVTAELLIEWPAGPLGVVDIACVAPDGTSVQLVAKEPFERAEIWNTYLVEADGVTLLESDVGFDFSGRAGRVWPSISTSAGSIEGQEWMSDFVRLDEPIAIETAAVQEIIQLGAGLLPEVARVAPTPFPAPPQGEAPPAIEVPLPAGQPFPDEPVFPVGTVAPGGGISGKLVVGMAAGLAVIALVVIAVLRIERD